jgi:transcriptional regulator with XRE-family HTH domain
MQPIAKDFWKARVMDESWERVAEAVRNRRHSLGLTQVEAAAAGGVSEPTWYLIEHARQDRYKPRTLRGIARALEWPEDAIDRIRRGEDPENLPHTPSLGIPAGLSQKLSEATPEELIKLEAYLDGLFANRRFPMHRSFSNPRGTPAQPTSS